MDKSTFTVYWMYKAMVPNALQFEDMGKALAWMEDLRKRAATDQLSAITMCSEISNHVGKPGVDEVKDGKTPDGIEYTWNKASRIGATRK